MRIGFEGAAPRRWPALFVVLVVGLALFCCTDRQATEELKSYLSAVLGEQPDLAYGCLSSEDRAARSLDEYRNNYSELRPGAAFGQVAHQPASFKILHVSTHENRGVSKVRVTMPAWGRIVDTTFGTGMTVAHLKGKDPAWVAEKIRAEYAGEDLPTQTEICTFHLRREDGHWKIYLDLETEIRLAQLLERGRKLEKDKELVEARACYQEALKLAKMSRVRHSDQELLALTDKLDRIHAQILAGTPAETKAGKTSPEPN